MKLPELPEVETSCRGIAPHCLNIKIKKIIVRQPKLRWPVSVGISERAKQKEIHAVERRGKYILLQIDGGALMIHLGMSGSLRVISESIEPEKHDHVDIVLDNGRVIRYNDPRRFGSIIYNTEGLEHPLLKKLGVEPLTEMFNVDYLYSIAKKRSLAVKSLIMNSHVVVGVGNIYAQEALFSACISPHKAANKISKAKIKCLVAEIKRILEEAIVAGGSSLKDFSAVDGKPGYFQHSHQVYGRGGLPCPQCKKSLSQKTINQRATVYCRHCQK